MRRPIPRRATRHHHFPATCEEVTKWEERNPFGGDTTGGKEMIQFLQKNTKPCPKCKTPTEKNGGCMYERRLRVFIHCLLD